MNSYLLEQVGIDPAYIIIGLLVFIFILFILYIVDIVKINKLKKRLELFLKGKEAISLEDTLLKRLDQVDFLVEAEKRNKEDISKIFENLSLAFQKKGIVKYDAFHEMGGKLSFALALLDKNNDGYIINAMHTREGCYTYIKEIVKGNSYIVLAEEEKEALGIAVNFNKFI